MKLLVHDYAGHPFQLQLSRELAMRGHSVIHVYFADNYGPKGAFDRADDAVSIEFVGIRLGRLGRQTNLLARRFADVAYGRKVSEVIRRYRPDVVISGNTPTEAQRRLLSMCKTERIRFVYWVQDIYSVAVSKLLARQFGFLGSAVGLYYRLLDRRQFRDSDAIVAISEDFVPLLASWARDRAKISVIENWAALGDIPVLDKDNEWSREHQLSKTFSFIYSGTLGRKHNPGLLVRLARAIGPAASVVAVAQGVGIEHLQAAKSAHGLDNLRLLPLQPFEHLPRVLATGDVLVAIIEAEAGQFAVPSKVLSYLCAGRPILLAAPSENLAARTVVQAEAGIVVEPGDEAGFVAAAIRLQSDPALRAKLGSSGRRYAEKTFDMTRIADAFENVLWPEWKSYGAMAAQPDSAAGGTGPVAEFEGGRVVI